MKEMDVLDYFINNFDTAIFDKSNNKYKFTNGLSLFLNDKIYEENPYIIRPKLRTCCKCKIDKSYDFYHKNKSKKDGYNSECNQCRKEFTSIYFKTDKHKLLHKEYIKKMPFGYEKQRIRSATSQIRKRSNSPLKTCDVLGCSYEFIFKYLDLSNNIKKEIDHIIPLSWAETEEEVINLGHYSNLQMLDKFNNLSKNNRFCLKKNLQKVYKYHPNIEIIKPIINRNQDKIKD
jgi:hypothetical protein